MKKKESNNRIILILMGIIIIILLILCVLFATNVISLNLDNNSKSDEINDTINKNDNGNDKNAYNRDEAIIKLKEVLSDDEWIKNNLYAKTNCFRNEVNDINQKLYFLTLSYEENNPIVIVLNYTDDNFITTCYKVYFSNGNVVVKNISGYIGHPSHEQFSVDKEQGLVILSYAHMGYYSFTAYDIKKDEIEVYDKYVCNTDNCDYEYKGDKQYGELSYISTELTTENINKYLK